MLCSTKWGYGGGQDEAYIQVNRLSVSNTVCQVVKCNHLKRK